VKRGAGARTRIRINTGLGILEPFCFLFLVEEMRFGCPTGEEPGIARSGSRGGGKRRKKERKEKKDERMRGLLVTLPFRYSYKVPSFSLSLIEGNLKAQKPITSILKFSSSFSCGTR
jgi:hypothetical protein